MPYDKESGKSYNSPTEALADALPEGEDAEEVMGKLSDMGYDLKPAKSAVGVSIEMESKPEGSEEKEEAMSEEAMSEEAMSEEDAGGEEQEAEGSVDLAMGVVEAPESMAKKRDKVASNLMDKFKQGMV